MALYSVWDWKRNSWRVYRTKASVSVGDDPLPPRPSNISVLGANPDTDVKPLPKGAAFVGYDHLCRGEIRRLPNGDGFGDDAGQDARPSGLVMFVAGAAVVGALWWWSGR